MVTQPLDPEIPEQPGKPNSEVEPEIPVEETPQPSQEAPAPPPETGDYISEIRQSLVSEETSRSKRGTGSLIRRITGSLRRVTGPLRKTGELSGEKAESAPDLSKPEMFENLSAAQPDSGPAAEITDELLAGRLEHTQEQEITDGFFAGRFGESAVDGAPTISLTEDWSNQPDSGSEAGGFLEMEEEHALPTPGDGAPISFLESDAIAAPGIEEEEAAQGNEPDWMSEIRAEARGAAPAAGPDTAQTSEGSFETAAEQPTGERTSLRGATGQLRNFIAGILGRSKEKQSQPEETDISDALVSDRLERSLGTETEERSGTGFVPPEAGEGLLEEQFPAAFHETSIIDETSLLETQVSQEKVDFFEGLEVNFTDVGEIEPSEEISGYELYPDDEALLWDNVDQATTDTVPPEIPITPEDIWGSDNDLPGYGSDLRREIWGDAAKLDTPGLEYFSPAEIEKPDDEDTFAATYLTGTDFLPPMANEEKSSTEDLLSQMLEESPANEETVSVQDLRSIALEDYEEGEEFDYSDYTYKIDWGDEDRVVPVEAETETEKAESEQAKLWAEEVEEESREALSTDWKSWFANRKTSQKIFLVEAAVVVIAMVIALPYFLFMMLRGPLTQTVPTQPGALPAGLPYPTGLTLPGGWYFPLERSTLTNGKWQPRTSEWLEGSELRRVVALPWSPQTEAVIKTFQKGDEVALYLSNGETLKYQVSSIERVEVTNTQIYSDRNPSLAIILYQEKDPTRWVIICKP